VSKDDIQNGQESTAELEGGTLQRGWDTIAGASVPRKQIEVTWAARTDIGRVRENNEDKFDFFLPDDPATLALRGRLWAVADGMGGHSAGQVASEAALKTLVRSYYNPSDTDAEGALKAAICDANSLIFRAAQRMGGQNGMGTTLVVLVAIEDRFLVAHVGDSRIYRWRSGGPRKGDTSFLTQLTTDHSWVEEQVSRKSLTREQAEASPYRNMITRSVGVEENVVPDVSVHPAEPGDVYLLCSDGLSGFLDDAILRQTWTKLPTRRALY
jgi:protein phosphatase